MKFKNNEKVFAAFRYALFFFSYFTEKRLDREKNKILIHQIEISMLAKLK